MARLALVSGGERREWELAAVNTLGRHPNNSIQVLDRIVSKEHATIRRRPDGKWVLKDLDSLNGTYVGGQRVTEHDLAHGDEITFGTTKLQFLDALGSEADVDRVTIAPNRTDSHIRQRIAADKEFRPEREVFDIEGLRRDYEKLRIAYEVGRSIGLELDTDRLLEKILDKAFEILQADRGVFLLIDPQTGRPVPRVAKQKSGRKEEIVLSTTVLNEVVQHKTAVLSSDALMDSRFSGAHSIIMQGIRSTMTVPVLIGDELLGIMHLDSQIASGAFTDKDLQVFTGVAAQAAVALQNARLARKIEDEAKTRAQMQRLLAPELVEQVVSGKLSVGKGGQERDVTVLFADIRGFTTMSEARPASEIVVMLNEYFEVMVEVLARYKAYLDKYVGDEMMVLFGAPIEMSDGPVQAVLCAVEMQRALREFNRTRVSENQEPIRIGIGINTGTVTAGFMGASKTMQYTVIGDPVNAASRLCSLAKAGEIIVSEATMRHVRDRVEAVALPPAKVKGKHEELRIYNVIGLAGEGAWRAQSTDPGV